MTSRNWHVLGAGAMGCLFSQQLVAAGATVTLLQRTPPSTKSTSIRVECCEEQHLVPVTLSAVTEEQGIELLLATTKAPDIAAAVSSVRHRMTADTDIVLAANGMGFVNAVQAALPHNRIYCCTSTEGAHRLAALHIRHAGRGVTRLGSVHGLGQPPWFSDWQNSALDCHWETDINHALWQKLAINCAINPLTALHRCQNGQLANSPALRAQVDALCDEIAAVSLAGGFEETAANVHARVAAVIAGTAENRSSMLQDIEAGRPTEIEFITGHLVCEAERLGIDVPNNRQLLEKVRALAD